MIRYNIRSVRVQFGKLLRNVKLYYNRDRSSRGELRDWLKMTTKIYVNFTMEEQFRKGLRKSGHQDREHEGFMNQVGRQRRDP